MHRVEKGSLDQGAFISHAGGVRINTTHWGGEVFTATMEPSENSVLWGELFKEKERAFLRKNIRLNCVSFAIRDTFQIQVRTMFQPEAQQASLAGMQRPGRFVVLLHGLSGLLKTSWTWAKLARPLFQQGFSVIMIDLPGFGRSTMNATAHCSISGWKAQAWHVLLQTLDNLGVHKCHIVAVGETSEILFQLLQRSHHSLAKEHVLYNPVIGFDELFGRSINGGTGPGWRDVLRAQQHSELSKLIGAHGTRIWALYKEHDLQNTPGVFDSVQSLIKLSQDPLPLVFVNDINDEDVCECQIGAQVPLYFLFPSKHIKRCVADFLWAEVLRPPAFDHMQSRRASMRHSIQVSDDENLHQEAGQHEHMAQFQFNLQSKRSERSPLMSPAVSPLSNERRSHSQPTLSPLPSNPSSAIILLNNSPINEVANNTFSKTLGTYSLRERPDSGASLRRELSEPARPGSDMANHRSSRGFARQNTFHMREALPFAEATMFGDGTESRHRLLSKLPRSMQPPELTEEEKKPLPDFEDPDEADMQHEQEQTDARKKSKLRTSQFRWKERMSKLRDSVRPTDSRNSDRNYSKMTTGSSNNRAVSKLSVSSMLSMSSSMYS